jgi:RNA polymerase sigma factor (sigma-70 family)
MSTATAELLHRDTEWLIAFRIGDRRALERVYRAYARPVERYLHAVVRQYGGHRAENTTFVADLLQEVFLRAFSADARRAYDGLRSYEHYLVVVARNCFIDMMRARRREVLTSPEDLPFDIETAPEPEQWCDGRTLEVLEGYVGGLTPALRAIYAKRFLEEVSQAETADLLGITRRAVRTGERRLRAGLRKALVRAGIPVQRSSPVERLLSSKPGRLAAGNRGPA